MFDVRSRRTLGVGAAFIILAGCGGSQPAFDVPAGTPPTQQVLMDGSWMLPEAKSKDLLYISDCCFVSVYSYPEGNLEGKIKGFNNAEGECVDKAGDVFISDVLPGRIYEYRHGGIKSIASFDVPLATGCAIDPTTGNLAGSGGYGVSSGSGGVFVFPNASGTPTRYQNAAFDQYWFVGYDNAGNLFADGVDYEAHFVFAELPKGGSSLKTITLNKYIKWPGGIQWDGKHLAVGDYENPIIYRFRFSGSQGISAGTVNLGSTATDVGQFFIQGRRLIAPNQCYPHCPADNALFFKYPVGGTATKTITADIGSPSGASVSLAPNL